MRTLTLLFCLAAAPALAQGNDSSSSTAAASGGGTQGAQVTVGAGAVSAAATIGASGPASPSAAKPPPAPLAPGFAIRPQADPFWGPAMLPIALDRPQRCDIVEDANARRHCQTRGGRNREGTRP